VCRRQPSTRLSSFSPFNSDSEFAHNFWNPVGIMSHYVTPLSSSLSVRDRQRRQATLDSWTNVVSYLRSAALCLAGCTCSRRVRIYSIHCVGPRFVLIFLICQQFVVLLIFGRPVRFL
jgi:hypothetical protein